MTKLDLPVPGRSGRRIDKPRLINEFPQDIRSRWVGGTESDIGGAEPCGVGGVVIGLLL